MKVAHQKEAVGVIISSITEEVCSLNPVLGQKNYKFEKKTFILRENTFTPVN